MNIAISSVCKKSEAIRCPCYSGSANRRRASDMSIASHFRVVDQDVLQKVHERTMQVLDRAGVVFKSDECLRIFAAHGARVDGQRVYLPAEMVEQAIASTPSLFRWTARNDEHSIDVGARQSTIHVSLNNGPIYIQDSENGRRLGTETDLVNLYKLAQQSRTCSIVGQIPVEPVDLAGPVRHLEIFKRLLTHADKPLYAYVGDRQKVQQMFDMVRIAHGSPLDSDAIFAEHRIAVSINPLSPLQYDGVPCETLLAYARLRQPIMILTCAMAGVTAPADPIGTVILQNAEILASLTLTQLISPGMPVIYSPASAIPDMRTARYITGSPLSTMINMVNIQLARELYDIPNRCMAGLTDAKVVDCQAGYETMQNYLMLAMAGVNMVNECYGILDGIMTVSYEKFIIDDEIMDRAAQVVAGVTSFDEGYLADVIEELGPGGAYLMHPSTMKNCRKFWSADIACSTSYEDWLKKGSEDIVVRANRKFRRLLEECPEVVLGGDIEKELSAYIAAVAGR